MHVLSDIRLRLWAIAQFFYALFSGDKTWGDLRGTFRDEILHTAVLGHLNEMPYSCLEDRRILIGDPSNHPDEWYLAAIDGGLRRFEDLGRRKSGVLTGYCRAQRRHFASCPGCRAVGVVKAKEEIAAHKAITGIFDDLRRSDPDGFDRMIADVRERVRDRRP